jgi:hypothetical protein
MNVPHNAEWHKSTRSNAGGNCVEVARTPEVVGVRDSKDRHGPVLVFSPDAWTRFLDRVRPGDLDS